jgi:DMSO/TMAO reductase YedYZ molybdopterin-dependent catalytic subunit
MSEKQYNAKMLAAKEKLLERFRARAAGPTLDPPDGAGRPRLPRGQHLVSGFPVLDLGVRPAIDLATWKLKVTGQVREPWFFTWEQFRALPRARQQSDFHCVTSWSRYDLRWAGVPFRALAERVGVLPAARFVIAACGDGYTTNLPLADCLRDDTLLADELDGQPLPLEHGGPVRLLVPHLYAWKSAKFLRALHFATEDQPGFWEARGYHHYGDPWREQRYAPLRERDSKR